MPCNCKKPITQVENVDDPLQWGPILWKYLHTIAENLGVSGNKIVDTDQANYMDTILTTLHLIIPCKECQAHTASYIASNPLPTIKGLQGITLRIVVREWLFHFHNSVRTMKGQPIILNTPEECHQYNGNISKNDYTFFVQSVGHAVRLGLVRTDNWRKWYSNSERLRIISGIVI
jgi:hypothetical protein